MASRGFDAATFGRAFAGPGMDTRQWVSYGIVKPATAEDPVVTFDDEIGAPLITVLLQPSEVFVACRVAGSVAGNGEGEWDPWVEGDEVVVVIPGGNEKGGCVIIGRLNNSLDKWPTQVAGTDTTTNAVAFQRRRTPFIFENSSGILFRNAITESYLSLSQEGEWTMANTEGYFAVAHDFITMQTSDSSQLVQINMTDRLVALESDGSLFHLKSNAPSLLYTSGPLQIGTAGSAPAGYHATTVEGVVALIDQVFFALSTVLAGSLNPAVSPVGIAMLAAKTAAINAGIAAVAAGAPVTPPGIPFNTAYGGAIIAALQVPPDQTGQKPNIGAAGLTIS